MCNLHAVCIMLLDSQVHANNTMFDAVCNALQCLQESELSKQNKMLTLVGDRLRNYTCADPTMVTSEKPIREFTWQGSKVYTYYCYEYDSKILC
jgi:phosphoribosylformylglycinamidine (FGAM) synthase-like amidotransferase family enzyme